MRRVAMPALLALALGACSNTTPVSPAGDDSRRDEPGGGTGAPDQPGAGGQDDAPGDPAETVSASARPRLQWKRYSAFEADLSRALSLPAESLCTEFGGESCIRSVHLVPLGGYEPFSTGLLEPAAEPLATTPTVVDRIVLSACGQRVRLDAEAGADASVFKLDLAGSAPAAEDARVAELATTLYRRFLARDPDPAEVRALGELTVDDAGKPVSASEFAQLACFVVGTASEFLFF